MRSDYAGRIHLEIIGLSVLALSHINLDPRDYVGRTREYGNYIDKGNYRIKPVRLDEGIRRMHRRKTI